jgi:hypothetical protein
MRPPMSRKCANLFCRQWIQDVLPDDADVAGCGMYDPVPTGVGQQGNRVAAVGRVRAVNRQVIWFWLKFREADGLPIAAEIDTRSGCERSRSLVWRGDGSLQVGGAPTRIVMTWRYGC